MGDYLPPTTFYGNQKQPLIARHSPWNFVIQCWGLKGWFLYRKNLGWCRCRFTYLLPQKRISKDFVCIFHKKIYIYIYMYICMYAYFSNGFHPIHLLVMNCAVSYKKQQKLPGVDRKTLQWDSWVQNEGKSLMVGGHSCSVQRKRVFWMTSVFESTLLDVTNVESWISANLSPPTLKWWFCKGNLQVLSGLMNCLTIYVQKYGTEWIIIKSYWRGTAFFKAFRYVEVPWPPVKSWDYQQNSE